MNWSLDKSKPMCPQICERICVAIFSGEFSAGEKLLSVREFALKTGVNPNTVQKALDELEKRGVIHSVPCSGWYVNDNTQVAHAELAALRMKKTREYLTAMLDLGCTPDQIHQYLKQFQEENHE